MNPLHVCSATENVGPSIPWIEPPDRSFAGHSWSRLVASGLSFEQIGQKVIVDIPLADRTDREEIIENLKHLGFNGLREFTRDVALSLLVVTVVVEAV